MASFQAKKGWKRTRKSENKNCLSVPFRTNPMRNRKFQKNSKKIQKIEKCHYGVISSQNWLEKVQRENKNFHFVSFRLDALEKIQEI